MEGLSNLGIDLKSILFYIVNIGFLILILWYLLYDPILNILNKRQKTISDTIEEANRIKSEFEKKLTEIEAEKAKTQTELKQEIDKMEKFIEQRKAELTEEIEAEKNKMFTKANQDIEKRKAELVNNIEKELLTIIKKIVLEIVHNKVPAEVIQDSVSEAWVKYKK